MTRSREVVDILAFSSARKGENNFCTGDQREESILTQEISRSTTCRQERDGMHLVGCPTCARPAKVRSQFFGSELACRHCSATFVVTELVDGSKLARSTTANRYSERLVTQLMDR